MISKKENKMISPNIVKIPKTKADTTEMKRIIIPMKSDIRANFKWNFALPAKTQSAEQ